MRTTSEAAITQKKTKLSSEEIAQLRLSARTMLRVGAMARSIERDQDSCKLYRSAIESLEKVVAASGSVPDAVRLCIAYKRGSFAAYKYARISPRAITQRWSKVAYRWYWEYVHLRLQLLRSSVLSKFLQQAAWLARDIKEFRHEMRRVRQHESARKAHEPLVEMLRERLEDLEFHEMSDPYDILAASHSGCQIMFDLGAWVDLKEHVDDVVEFFEEHQDVLEEFETELMDALVHYRKRCIGQASVH